MEINVIVGKWVMGNFGKNGVANQHVANVVRGARVINWSVANPILPWELDEVST